MTRPDNPAAFPSQHRWESGDLMEPANGMSLREYYIGQAVVGLLASGAFNNSGPGFEHFMAEHAANIADVLLLARKGNGA